MISRSSLSVTEIEMVKGEYNIHEVATRQPPRHQVQPPGSFTTQINNKT